MDVRLPGHDKPQRPVVARGLGEKPMLLTNVAGTDSVNDEMRQERSLFASG